MTGNCVDKFIQKKVVDRLNDLIHSMFSIRSRIYNRENESDYFGTNYYEQDFNDIIKLRDDAKQLMEDCNKFLERISEQYSKFN